MIGITGQIGAGKSFVGQILRDRGFKVVDADLAVHELYRDCKELRQSIAKEFGPEALTDEGINRKFIADLIFRDECARLRLEQMVYPQLTSYIQNQQPDYVEAALFENVPQLVATLESLWIVTAPADIRLQRLTSPGRGLSLDDARRRMQLQADKNSPDFWQKLFPGKLLRFIDNGGDTVPEI